MCTNQFYFFLLLNETIFFNIIFTKILGTYHIDIKKKIIKKNEIKNIKGFCLSPPIVCVSIL